MILTIVWAGVPQARAEDHSGCEHPLGCSLQAGNPLVFAADRTKQSATEGVLNPIVRVMYMIPANRAPQPQGVMTLQHWLMGARGFFLDRMQVNGFGPMTFEYETEADGITPMVHVVSSGHIDETFRLNPAAFIPIEANRAGLPLYQKGEIWIVICEMHKMEPDGAIRGIYNGGYNNIIATGRASEGGSAVSGSAVLPFLRPGLMLDGRDYHGLTMEDLGPYPMVHDVTAEGFEGRTLSDLASIATGALVHELGHAFGLFWHDFRMDENFHGNLMGNGFRGIRSYYHDELFPEDQTRLGWDQALFLSNSPYFRRNKATRGVGIPNAQVLESTKGNVKEGNLVVTFDASDADSPLAAAFLLRGFDIMDSMKLKGNDGRWEFRTPYFTPGKLEEWTLYVQDVDGNLAKRQFKIRPDAHAERAPIPNFKADRLKVKARQIVQLDARASRDPDNEQAVLSFQWDLNGDNQPELGPDKNKDIKVSYPETGFASVRLKVTDTQGHSAWSPRVGIQILEPAVNAAGHWGGYF